MMILPVRVHYQQHGSGGGLDLSCADRVPAWFSCFVNTVQANEAVCVFKDQSCQLE